MNGNGKNAKQIWQTALGELQLQVNKANYVTYLKDTFASGFDGATFTIAHPNGWARDWLEGRLSSTVKKTLIGILGHTVDLRFVVQADDGGVRFASSLSPLEEWAAEARPDLQAPRDARLNPRYVFDTFVVGPSNRLAHAAAEAVAAQPGFSYNPLFVYGGVGLGKTHLLHAIGHAGLARGLRVLYVSSEQFTNEFIKAIRDRQNEAFRAKYRGVDILLIDDIQFLASREQTQEEFFHTFNDLHSANKQIVISSDRSPKSMPSLEDRLRSRFEWGLITDVQAPDFETRVAILETKARAHNLDLPSEVLEMVAHKAQNNIRELEGSLNKILVFARTHGLTINGEVAHQALVDAAHNGPRRRVITPKQVVDAVCNYYKVDERDIRGKRRDRDIARPRQIAMFLIRDLTQCSLGEIGKELGGRDHTTIIYGCEKIEKDLDSNQTLAREVNELKTQLFRA